LIENIFNITGVAGSPEGRPSQTV